MTCEVLDRLLPPDTLDATFPPFEEIDRPKAPNEHEHGGSKGYNHLQ